MMLRLVEDLGGVAEVPSFLVGHKAFANPCDESMSRFRPDCKKRVGGGGGGGRFSLAMYLLRKES